MQILNTEIFKNGSNTHNNVIKNGSNTHNNVIKSQIVLNRHNNTLLLKMIKYTVIILSKTETMHNSNLTQVINECIEKVMEIIEKEEWGVGVNMYRFTNDEIF
jgi:hypothetical protein